MLLEERFGNGTRMRYDIRGIVREKGWENRKNRIKLISTMEAGLNVVQLDSNAYHVDVYMMQENGHYFTGSHPHT